MPSEKQLVAENMLEINSRKFAGEVPPSYNSNGLLKNGQFLTLYAVQELPFFRLFSTERILADSSGLIEQITGKNVIYDSVLLDYEVEIGGRVRDIARRRVERGISSLLNFGNAFERAAKSLSEYGNISYDALLREYSSKDIFDKILGNSEARETFFYELENYVNSTTFPGRNSAVLDYLESLIGNALPESFSLLDVGCSNMTFLAEARKRFPGAELSGTDIYDVIKVEEAEEIPFIKANILAEPLSEMGYSSLDVATSFALLNLHLNQEGSAKALYNMALGLKPGGLIIAGSESIIPYLNGAEERIYSYLVLRKNGSGENASLEKVETISSHE